MSQATNQPGHGRATAEQAFGEHTKQIALRNQQAQKTARGVRQAREQKESAAKKRRDLW